MGTTGTTKTEKKWFHRIYFTH